MLKYFMDISPQRRSWSVYGGVDIINILVGPCTEHGLHESSQETLHLIIYFNIFGSHMYNNLNV